MVDEVQAYINSMRASINKSARNNRRYEISRSVAASLVRWKDLGPVEIAITAVKIANALLEALAEEEAAEE